MSVISQIMAARGRAGHPATTGREGGTSGHTWEGGGSYIHLGYEGLAAVQPRVSGERREAREGGREGLTTEGVPLWILLCPKRNPEKSICYSCHVVLLPALGTAYGHTQLIGSKRQEVELF